MSFCGVLTIDADIEGEWRYYEHLIYLHSQKPIWYIVTCVARCTGLIMYLALTINIIFYMGYYVINFITIRFGNNDWHSIILPTFYFFYQPIYKYKPISSYRYLCLKIYISLGNCNKKLKKWGQIARIIQIHGGYKILHTKPLHVLRIRKRNCLTRF